MKEKDRNTAFDKDFKEWDRNKPYGWIQFKGTSLCMDVHCRTPGCEDEVFHIDGDFIYEVQCPRCKQAYYISGFVKLIPIENPSIHIKIAEE